LVEVSRGAMVESRHRGAVAVVESSGSLVLGKGVVGTEIFPRSAIKPLQALLLIESGAADRFGITPEEIALACASHTGEPRHLSLIERWLTKIGCSAADLECGPEPPRTPEDLRNMVRDGGKPTPLHNNCSGKHAGFLTVAKHLGVPTRGYIEYDHPVQQYLRKILSEVFETDLERAPRGIDGCGIPVLAVRLDRLARGMARLADPSLEPEKRQAAMLRIRQAMAAHPFLVAGTGRFTTAVTEITKDRALLKGGAEGVFCAALPQQKLGIAIKIEDGAGRAAEVAAGALLLRFGAIGEAEAAALANVLEPRIVNWAGAVVGQIRPAENLRA
jgi:L-asparaginase II